MTVTVNNPATGAFTATGSDAQGDTLVSIENLAGSRFGDRLTGSTNNNILAGGLGSDTLDGAAGVDTADYSRDLFIDAARTADRVDVRLGLSGASGTGSEFSIIAPDNFLVQISVDTLIGIENVIGTPAGDSIFGNELTNTLDGRGGDDLLDGGFGNDILIGGEGIDRVTFASHDTARLQVGTISLGLNGNNGTATFSNSFFTSALETDKLIGIENVLGSNLDEKINGNEQANTLAGRGGNDTVNGGAGDDSYDMRGQFFALGDDRFFDTSGSDRVLISSFNDIASATQVGNDLRVVFNNNLGSFTVTNHFAGNQIENIQAGSVTRVLSVSSIGGNGAGIIAGTEKDDVLDGRGGDDILFGDKGSDHLLGGEGNDLLRGGKGKDVLEGGSGNDSLEGGDGPDTFVFAPSSSVALPAGDDVILDFGNSDTIDLSAFGTRFKALDDDRDGRLEDGESGGGIAITIDDGDTVFSFAGGSIRVLDTIGLQAHDLLL